jgi:CRISPR-associated protein Cas1
MIKRTLYFGNNAYLHTKGKQLVVDFADKEKTTVQVPIEDIGVVILDAHQLTISQALLNRLLSNNVALITCDQSHMPQGLMLNLEGNILQQERFHEQIKASLPLKKQLWQQTIRAKIHNQGKLLVKLGKSRIDLSVKINVYGQLENIHYWEYSVRSGDPDNYEGRAAAFYWSIVFSDMISKFKRGQFEAEPNSLLNYGYAILRAITARSLVASGLLPTFGIHHHNKYNAYALADDIMEPYRPFVDYIVREIIEENYSEEWEDGNFELNTEIKKKLLQIPVLDVNIANEKSPLMIAMQRTTSSLRQCFCGEAKKLLYPEFQI